MLISEHQVTEDHLLHLTCHYGVLRDWLFVSRSLGLNEADLEEIRQQHTSLKEQVYQALILWRERTEREVQRTTLAEALKRWNLHSAAGKIVLFFCMDFSLI